ncbi:hypothetical protein AWB76_06772 [Caballeronia temeraria]|uniref:Uncharacterized protein n=1 Tax=Caballeronia temeraria TaxID=1777137 RepID=A0A158DBY5_9BURK|nr:hypothetical protein AWB76_06772 [Caballeronia temeraria]
MKDPMSDRLIALALTVCGAIALGSPDMDFSRLF